MRVPWLLAVVALAGCTTSPDEVATATTVPEPVSGNEDVDPAEAESRTWSLSRESIATLTALGADEETAFLDCPWRRFSLPMNTTHVAVRMAWTTLDPDDLRAGTAHFRIRPDASSDWQRVDGAPTDAERVYEQADPSAGDWEIWIWPDGATVQQRFEFTVSATGEGDAPPSRMLDLQPGGRCAA